MFPLASMLAHSLREGGQFVREGLRPRCSSQKEREHQGLRSSAEEVVKETANYITLVDEGVEMEAKAVVGESAVCEKLGEGFTSMRMFQGRKEKADWSVEERKKLQQDDLLEKVAKRVKRGGERWKIR